MGRLLLESHRHPKLPRLTLDLRADSRYWQARTFLDGKVRLKSTKVESLPAAFRVAEAWYRQELRASIAVAREHPLDRLASTPTIGELYASYRTMLTKARRAYCDTKWGAVAPFWRAVPVTDVTAAKVREYYKTRRRHKTQYGDVPTNNTLAKDATLLRAILKHAIEERHISDLPPLPKPGKILDNPRPWLTRDEFNHLLTVATRRLSEARGNRRLTQQRLDLYQFIITMVETCMRVEELRQLTAGQVRFRDGYALVDVRGKRGHRQAVASGAAFGVLEMRVEGLADPEERIGRGDPELRIQERLAPRDRVWRYSQRDGFANLLDAAGLAEDAFGNPRNLKCLRSTGISLRVLTGAPSPNLVGIARQAGTSIEVIDRYYVRRLSAEMFPELRDSVIPEPPDPADGYDDSSDWLAE
jgi:integrase